jgi:Sulfotransferase family
MNANTTIYWPEKTFLVSKAYKFVYCPIPKTACSSFKQLIVKLSQAEIDNTAYYSLRGADFHMLVNDTFRLSTFPNEEALEILNDDEYFKFIFVRNPWERVASAYMDKFARRETLEPYAKDVVAAYHRQKGNPDSDEEALTFRQFVEYLATHDDKQLNEHWLPQHLFFGNTKFDFVGRFEHIAEDYKVIQEKLNISEELPWLNSTKQSEYDDSKEFSNLKPYEFRKLWEEGFYPFYQNLYTPDLVTMIASRYKEDVERFGYTFSAPAKLSR